MNCMHSPRALGSQAPNLTLGSTALAEPSTTRPGEYVLGQNIQDLFNDLFESIDDSAKGALARLEEVKGVARRPRFSRRCIRCRRPWGK